MELELDISWEPTVMMDETEGWGEGSPANLD
jgi:hypothetical protein